jgi:hypothetical protein
MCGKLVAMVYRLRPTGHHHGRLACSSSAAAPGRHAAQHGDRPKPSDHRTCLRRRAPYVLIGLGMVGLGSRLIAFLAQGRAQAFKFRIDDQVYDAPREMRAGQRG